MDDSGELTPFDRIVAAKVVVANETLYLNRKDGFAGYGLKDEAIEKCSDMDGVLVIGKDGVMKVMKVADKMFVGKSPLRVAVFEEMTKKSTIWFIGTEKAVGCMRRSLNRRR